MNIMLPYDLKLTLLYKISKYRIYLVNDYCGFGKFNTKKTGMLSLWRIQIYWDRGEVDV